MGWGCGLYKNEESVRIRTIDGRKRHGVWAGNFPRSPHIRGSLGKFPAQTSRRFLFVDIFLCFLVPSDNPQMHHHLPLQLALQYRAEDAGVHGLDAVVAEDEVPVGGQGAGIGQVITLGGAFTVGVGLVLGLAVYEEPAILKVYFVAGQTDDTFYVLFTGRQTHRDDVAAMIFRDDAEIESQLAIVQGGIHGVALHEKDPHHQLKEEYNQQKQRQKLFELPEPAALFTVISS